MKDYTKYSHCYRGARLLRDLSITNFEYSGILQWCKAFQINSTAHVHVHVHRKLAFSKQFWTFLWTEGAFNRLIIDSERHPHLSWVKICLQVHEIQAPAFNICIQNADQRMEVFKSSLDCCRHTHADIQGEIWTLLTLFSKQNLRRATHDERWNTLSALFWTDVV